MKELQIQGNEAGQRLDKLLFKYLNEAPASFVYKMLRKKNITLNGKKATGKEQLKNGDVVKLFLADDTIKKFQSQKKVDTGFSHIRVIYEDEQVLLLNKPAGMLSQKAKPSDVSMNEEMIAYLLNRGEISERSLKTFTPAVCNRLDRNTAGILICGKTLSALQILSEYIRDRKIGKFYRCVVEGCVPESDRIRGYLVKDEQTNKVCVSAHKGKGAAEIETAYKPICTGERYTELEVELVTGKTHQIRAHLSSIGHPICGDRKYGARQMAPYQMLYACRIAFPDMPEPLEKLSGKVFQIAPPAEYEGFVNRLDW